MRRSKLYPLEQAREVLDDFRSWIGPCKRLQEVGSVRRERPHVRDLDLLLWPRSVEELDQVLCDLEFDERAHPRARDWSDGYRRMVHCQYGMPVDIYVCQDIRAWSTRLVLLTGGPGFLAELKQAARAKRYVLTEDGIEKAKGRLSQPRSEQHLCQALGVQFRMPAERA